MTGLSARDRRRRLRCAHSSTDIKEGSRDAGIHAFPSVADRDRPAPGGAGPAARWPAAASSATPQSLCIGHHPQDFVWYTASCTGHDEPEIDPLSTAAGSAQNLTWTLVLPSNGAVPVDVGRPRRSGSAAPSPRPDSLDNQAFLRAPVLPQQSRPRAAPGGGCNVTRRGLRRLHGRARRSWEVSQAPASPSRRRSMHDALTDSQSGGPLIMKAGDTITDHQYITSAADGMHITVTDLNSGHSGTIVLNSHVDGPLMPDFSVAEDRQRARLGPGPRHAQRVRQPGDRGPHRQLHHAGRSSSAHPGHLDQAALLLLQRADLARLLADPDQERHLRLPQHGADRVGDRVRSSAPRPRSTPFVRRPPATARLVLAATRGMPTTRPTAPSRTGATTRARPTTTARRRTQFATPATRELRQRPTAIDPQYCSTPLSAPIP